MAIDLNTVFDIAKKIIRAGEVAIGTFANEMKKHDDKPTQVGNTESHVPPHPILDKSVHSSVNPPEVAPNASVVAADEEKRSEIENQLQKIPTPNAQPEHKPTSTPTPTPLK